MNNQQRPGRKIRFVAPAKNPARFDRDDVFISKRDTADAPEVQAFPSSGGREWDAVASHLWSCPTQNWHTVPFKGPYWLGTCVWARMKGTAHGDAVKSYIVSGNGTRDMLMFLFSPERKKSLSSSSSSWHTFARRRAVRSVRGGSHQNSCYVKEVRPKLDWDFNKSRGKFFLSCFVAEHHRRRRRKFSRRVTAATHKNIRRDTNREVCLLRENDIIELRWFNWN